MVTPSTLIPPPSRLTSVLNFNRIITCFINEETSYDELDEEGRQLWSGSTETTRWSVVRFRASAVSCRRVNEDPNDTKWRFKLCFFNHDGSQLIQTVNIWVPQGWLPRTLLILLDKKLRFESDVVSVVNAVGGLDICGILREYGAQSQAELQSLMYLTESDRAVEGGDDVTEMYRRFNEVLLSSDSE